MTSSREQEFHACAIGFFKILDCLFLIFLKFEGPSLLVLGSPIKHHSFLVLLRVVRAVAGSTAALYFGRSVNSIQTMGSDYAHQITRYLPLLDFQTFLRPCYLLLFVKFAILRLFL